MPTSSRNGQLRRRNDSVQCDVRCWGPCEGGERPCKAGRRGRVRKRHWAERRGNGSPLTFSGKLRLDECRERVEEAPRSVGTTNGSFFADEATGRTAEGRGGPGEGGEEEGTTRLDRELGEENG